MPPVLTGPVTIRISGRRVLRATPVCRGAELLLIEQDGTELSAQTPLAVLLDRTDLIAALGPDGVPVETFWAGVATFRLRLRRGRGGAELTIETPDGRELDAHLAPVRAILPQRAWLFARAQVA